MRRGPGGDREGVPNLPRASAPFRDLRKLCVAATKNSVFFVRRKINYWR